MILRELATIQQYGTEARLSGRKIVFTDGCFDVFHIGHLNFLKRAKSLANDCILVVGINADDVIKEVKGASRPIIPLTERMAIVDAIRFVDIVTPVWSADPEEAVRIIMPDIYVKVEDYKGRVQFNWFKGDIVYVPRTNNTSTSLIEAKLDEI